MHGDRLKTVKPRETVTIGPFTIEFIRVTHSMPDCVALAITTPVGVIIHTGDFKIDQTPIDGEHFDLHRLRRARRAGRAGAVRRQHEHRSARASPARRIDVIEAFEEMFTSTQGKLVVAAFSSSIYRMQVLVDLAAQFDRKVAFVGRSMVQNAEIAQRLGYLRIPVGHADPRFATCRTTPSQDVLCMTTGSQGEPQAALPRIAIDDHRYVQARPRRHGRASRRAPFPATKRRSRGS